MKRIPPTLLALALLLPLPALAGHRAPPTGAVLVLNQSGTEVAVSLSGEPAKRLAPWASATFHAPAGDRILRATYRQFGLTRTLESDRLFVAPHGHTTVVLEPEDTARVLVTNTTYAAGELRVNGRTAATLQPGQSRVVSMPVGDAWLAFYDGGRLVDQAHLDVDAYAEPTWRVEPPPTGDLLVQNPLPIAVELVCARGLVRTVPAYGSTVYEDLPAGPFTLTARRVTDEPVDSVSVDVRPDRRSVWQVEPPSTGFLLVDSEHWTRADVYIDGRLVRQVAAGTDARLLVEVGRHRLTVRDDVSRTLYDTWVYVEPYDVARVDFGIDRHVTADADRHDERDDRGRHHDYEERDDDREHDGHRHGSGASCSMPE